jgi:Ca2+-binding RTX toxin-like protein
MIIRLSFRLTCLGLLALILVSAFSTMAATNTVDESGASNTFHQATAEELKPSICTQTLDDNVVTGGFLISDGNQSSLVLGTSGTNLIGAGGGDDCVLGGGGNDRLWFIVWLGGLDGGDGDDVILGGNGNDRLMGGAGNDYCDGGAGTDNSDGSCETETNIP